MLLVFYFTFRVLITNFIIMVRWIVIFLIIALVAAIFGFGGIAAGAAGIAKLSSISLLFF